MTPSTCVFLSLLAFLSHRHLFRISFKGKQGRQLRLEIANRVSTVTVVGNWTEFNFSSSIQSTHHFTPHFWHAPPHWSAKIAIQLVCSNDCLCCLFDWRRACLPETVSKQNFVTLLWNCWKRGRELSTSCRTSLFNKMSKDSLEKSERTPPVSWRPWALAYSRERPYNFSCLSARPREKKAALKKALNRVESFKLSWWLYRG